MSKEEYTIGQIAKRLNTTPRALRFYEQKKLIVPCKIDRNGYRIYSKKEVEDLQVVLYLRSLGFSIQKIKQLLTEENSSESLELLISQEIADDQEVITKLKEKQRKLVTLKKLIHQRKLDKDKISDITTIMKSNTELAQVRKKIIYYGLGILTLEIIGMLLIAGILLHHQVVLGEILAGLLVIILLIFSTIFAKKYYECVAYVCPNCGTKFVPSFKQFFFAAHTPRFRKLRCPHCHKKSYCLEVIR